MDKKTDREAVKHAAEKRAEAAREGRELKPAPKPDGRIER